MSTATAERPQGAVLDALAVLLALDRGETSAADQMAASYARCGELSAFMSALAAIALCAVRYSAIASGQAPERLLAGVAMEVRGAE